MIFNKQNIGRLVYSSNEVHLKTSSRKRLRSKYQGGIVMYSRKIKRGEPEYLTVIVLTREVLTVNTPILSGSPVYMMGYVGSDCNLVVNQRPIGII